AIYYYSLRTKHAARNVGGMDQARSYRSMVALAWHHDPSTRTGIRCARRWDLYLHQHARGTWRTVRTRLGFQRVYASALTGLHLGRANSQQHKPACGQRGDRRDQRWVLRRPYLRWVLG